MGMAKGYGLDGWGSIPRDFSLLHTIQIGSGIHPAYYPMGTVGFFPGGKAAEG
jgi:hypothetical protein